MTPEQNKYIISLDKDGNLTGDIFLDAALPENSIIHDLINWDEASSVHRDRLQQARAIIRTVRITYTPGVSTTRQLRIADYIRDPDAESNEQGYVRTTLLRTREESALNALKAELKRVESLVRRTRIIASTLGLEEECEAGLRDLLLLPELEKAS